MSEKLDVVTHVFAGVDQVKYLELLSKKVINEVNRIEYCDSFDGLFIKSFKLHNLSGFIFAFFAFHVYVNSRRRPTRLIFCR